MKRIILRRRRCRRLRSHARGGRVSGRDEGLHLVLLALVLVLLMPSSAAATPALAMPDGAARALYQSWLNMSALPVPTDPITVDLEQCDASTLTCIDLPTWAIRFPDLTYLIGQPDEPRQHAQFMHEIAHVLDHRLRNQQGYRQRYRRIMWGRRSTYTWRGSWWHDGDVPDAETFADAYAMCATLPHVPPAAHPYEGYGTYHPRLAKHERVCAMLAKRLR
jgi:hypothetical protein